MPIKEPAKDIYRSPCAPSPCGANSQCRDINGSASCSCLPKYLGAPPNCHPECTIHSECASDRACINEMCRDPCSGSCGFNSKCKVINHIPICLCHEGFTGDPFNSCYPKPAECKNFISTYFKKQIFLLIYIILYR